MSRHGWRGSEVESHLPPLTPDAVKEALRAAASRTVESVRTFWRCPAGGFSVCTRLLQEGGARLLTLSATRDVEEELVLTYTFELGRGSYLVMTTPTHERSLESLFSTFPAADFLEREVNQLFGVKFLGHPNLPQPTRHEKAH